MLFISSEKSNRDSLYLNLLVKNLQLEKFKDLQIVSVNTCVQKTLKLESVPLYIDSNGRSLMSLQEISRALTDLVRLTPLLIGYNTSESSVALKWFELDCNLRYTDIF
jgi:hypothetical protein